MLPPRPQLIDIRAKNNRFVPLKDGVYSPDLERSLLVVYGIQGRQGSVLNGRAVGREEFCIESIISSTLRLLGQRCGRRRGSVPYTFLDSSLILLFLAISNLVLFRNNFALNRDITGLFQAFQSTAPAVIFSLLGPLDDAFTAAMPAHPTATSNNELAVSGDVNDCQGVWKRELLLRPSPRTPVIASSISRPTIH
ncbi:hypothetical protein EV363DRAFT_1555201 [Boletus edulis]|nr:hypothetical protein EV363DRAFT_1555201 [Boletus edulis]